MKKMIYVIMFALLPLFTWAGTTENNIESQQLEVTSDDPMWINNFASLRFFGNQGYIFRAENAGVSYDWEVYGEANIVDVSEFDEYGNAVQIVVKMNPVCANSTFTLKLKNNVSGEEVVFEGRILKGVGYTCP